MDDIRRRLQAEAEKQRSEVAGLQAKAEELEKLAEKLRKKADANAVVAEGLEKALAAIDETLKNLPHEILTVEGDELIGEAEAALAAGLAEEMASGGKSGKPKKPAIEAALGESGDEEEEAERGVAGSGGGSGQRVPFVIGEGDSAVKLADFFINTKKGVIVAEFKLPISNNSEVMKVVVSNLLASLKSKEEIEYDVDYDDKLENVEKLTVSGLRPEQVGLVVDKLKLALNSDYKAAQAATGRVK